MVSDFIWQFIFKQNGFTRSPSLHFWYFIYSPGSPCSFVFPVTIWQCLQAIWKKDIHTSLCSLRKKGGGTFQGMNFLSRLLIQKRDMCLEPEVQDEGSEWIPCPKLWLEQLLHDLRGQQTDVYCSFGLEKHSLQAVSPLINRDGMCRGLVHSGVCRVILLSRIRNIF